MIAVCPMSTPLNTLLRKIARPGAFAVGRQISSADLSIEVKGVGPISLPMSSAQARALCSVAQPARHGFKDRTLLDRTVRDTWEVARSRIKIDQRRWKPVLAAELERFKAELGLAADCTLRAELHNLLVYSRGQFFVSHQDTEKVDGMIGTLVVTLPSKFSGGELVVQHHDEQLVFRGATRKLTLTAFYADCRHEVRPIEAGFRVVLTYNLVLSRPKPRRGKATQPPLDERLLDELQREVGEFFRTPVTPRWHGAPPGLPPDRLVYLLDHQYSQKGLAWNQLKNGDVIRVGALRKVADALDCDVALALADVHETWLCEDEDYGRGRYGRRRRSYYRGYDDDEASTPRGRDDYPELLELQDSHVELRHFVDANGKSSAASGDVAEPELCFTKPSVDLDPFQSAHEGYMGNWGNTVDHWYHRAAVVLWPRERTFLIRAKSSARFALDDLAKTLRREGVDVARGKAAQLAPFWGSVWHGDQDSRLVDKTLKVALGLDEPDLARTFVAPLGLYRMNADNAPVFLGLSERYGLPWFEGLLAGWSSRGLYDFDLSGHAWLQSFASVVRAIVATESSGAQGLARLLVADRWRALSTRHGERAEQRPSEALRTMTDLSEPLLQLIESACLVDASDVLTEMQRFLKAPEYPLLALTHLLKAGQGRRRPAALAIALRDVHAHCVAELKRRLASPARASDDWSMSFTSRCKCALCGKLSEFLRARDVITLEWPLAKDRRSHVHAALDARELPVAHVTRRVGSPYTLVLQKKPELFKREVAERAAWQRALQSLAPQKPARSRTGARARSR